MNKLTLKADKRKIIGRKVKTLRKEGIIPSNVFGKNVKSLALQTKFSDFMEVFKKAGETGIVYLEISGDKDKKEEKPVLIANVQKNPVTDLPIHVDFHQVDLKERVEADVPVELIGESSVEKQGLGTVVQYVDEVLVEALPTDLPEKFEIDVSTLIEVDQAVFVKDMKIDRTKVEIKLDADTILVKVEPPQKVEEVAPPVPTEVPVEGEAPSEGEEGKPAAETGKEEPAEAPKEEAPKS
ncbi:MAG: 50S ribosomal protein L25 [bacterium]